MSRPEPPVEDFALAGWRGQVLAARRPPDLERQLARLTDPGSAKRTLSWGRSYVYTAEIETATGSTEVAVKQFRNQGLAARWLRARGAGRAERSWRAALALAGAGVPTPEPLMLIESTAAAGSSYFVTRLLDDFVELRYVFRALAAGELEERFPGLDERALFEETGSTLRRLHDAGVWHRDLSIGNVLASFPRGEASRPTIHVIDLNRARTGRRLGVWRRTRDLCRLPVLRPDLRRAFLGSYWRGRTAGLGPKEALFTALARGFLAKNRLKAALRRPFRALAALLPRHAHPHIPPPPAGAGARDRVVWDELSDQPHQHAGRFGRLGVRLADGGIHARAALGALRLLPRVRRRERQLARGLYAAPRPWNGAGVALQAAAAAAAAQLAAIDELGVDRVLMRLHLWQEDLDADEALARELAARGVEVAYALAQNRDLVREPHRWRAAVERAADRFLPYGNAFQIGQAINRSKWGVWNPREYLRLAAAACEALRARGEVVLLGPAVIDFEMHALLGVLALAGPEVRFDGLASLLYVDRRGAPENRQLGYDTVGKIVVQRAAADVSGRCGERFWITEVNWPLWEGPHAPAGRHVAVDEQSQADYLARFYLLALGTGLVDRVYWWQLFARGYGLVEPDAVGRARRRPAFAALAHLSRRLAGASFLGPLPAPAAARLYRFRDRDGGELVVGWTAGEPGPAELPGRPAEVRGRNGETLPRPPGAGVELVPSPRYFRL